MGTIICIVIGGRRLSVRAPSRMGMAVQVQGGDGEEEDEENCCEEGGRKGKKKKKKTYVLRIRSTWIYRRRWVLGRSIGI